MARPYKTGLDYFAMDTDFDMDDKIGALLELHGNEGIGVIVRLWARMYKTADGVLNLSNPMMFKSLCRQLAISPKKLEKIIENSAEFGLFCLESWRLHHQLISNRVQTSIKNVNQNRERNRVNRHETEELSVPITPKLSQRPLDKVKEKEKENKIIIKETIKEKGNNNNLTKTVVENSVTEKITDDVGEVFALYEQEIGVLTPTVAEGVKTWLEENPAEHVKEAIKEASLAGVRKPAYINAILENWRTNGYKSQHRPRSPTRKSSTNGVQTAEEIEESAKRLGLI